MHILYTIDHIMKIGGIGSSLVRTLVVLVYMCVQNTEFSHNRYHSVHVYRITTGRGGTPTNIFRIAFNNKV